VACLDSVDHIYKDGYLSIEDSRIVDIGYQKDLPVDRHYDKVVDLGNRLVMPGLINAHTHSPMTLFRGHVEGHTLFNMEGWYHTIRVLEFELTKDMLPPAVSVSCAEMIRTGTTCFVDQYFWMDMVAPSVKASGLRAVLAYGIVELGEAEAREREIAAATAFLESLQGDDLLTGWVGPHAFFVDNSVEAMALEKKLAQRFNAGFHTHFGTSHSENNYCQKEYGHSALTQLGKMGFLDFPIIAAHSITIPFEDFPLVRDKPFTVAAAPSSGMRNAAGIAPLVELVKARVNVALGTDNVTNNNSYDMFKEMSLAGKLMALLHKDAAALDTRAILDMATMGGARAIGKESEIGSLEVGKKADFISLDLSEIGWVPFGGQDIYTAIVYSITGQHVRDVMVNGKWLFRENKFLTVDYTQACTSLEEKHTILVEKIRNKEGKR
ncbi:MAG: amidohydrolase family protein, partial [Anaerolineaceae bacterium]|nr:amidohydrolase family protein [Anaerolineaceae bacterium]